MPFLEKTTGHAMKELQSGSREGARKTNKNNWHTECLGSSHKSYLPAFCINSGLEVRGWRAIHLNIQQLEFNVSRTWIWTSI